MFGFRATIQVKVKLYGGLDSLAGVENYDPDVGLSMAVPENIRLGKAIKKLGLDKTGSISLFINGGCHGQWIYGEIPGCESVRRLNGNG